jgi:hypothetical protein
LRILVGDPEAVAALSAGRAWPLLDVRCSCDDAGGACKKRIAIVYATPAGKVVRYMTPAVPVAERKRGSSRSVWKAALLSNPNELLTPAETPWEAWGMWCPLHGYLSWKRSGSLEDDGLLQIEAKLHKAEVLRSRETVMPPAWTNKHYGKRSTA